MERVRHAHDFLGPAPSLSGEPSVLRLVACSSCLPTVQYASELLCNSSSHPYQLNSSPFVPSPSYTHCLSFSYLPNMHWL
ncbi:hypothetical protein LOK49_LG01G00516 [Camellia lanceoleosa]|uniref:Uncharacterized protein n=1 Tax=Camellia lanceoleosa TaxID=1840588 RepID=A0ACC0IUY9_9ERIC|nr:hypothetical protein LOK49_LG01G00516 [Camellia lanceoleosa]